MEFLCALVLFLAYINSGHGFYNGTYFYVYPKLNEIDCAKQALRDSYFEDGLYKAGCWGRLWCRHGNNEVLMCYPNQVYRRATEQCVDPEPATIWRCNVISMCFKKADGVYAWPKDPQRYYRCFGQLMHFDFNCGSGMVYNETAGKCTQSANLG